MIIFDIDGFKSYNDTFGHLAGDNILREVGTLIKKNIRENVDFGFRYGGDEFTIILNEVDLNKAVEVAERIKNGFRNLNLKNLSLSIGVSQYHNEDLDNLIARTDEIMYNAKKSGGNRVLSEKDK